MTVPSTSQRRPTVTVILLTYNFEAFVAEALDSVLTQNTDFPFDIVIIDDCSTDGTQRILNSYQSAYPDKIRLVLSDRNVCDNAALLTAIDRCQSDYVAVLDGDDYWSSAHKLQRQVEYMRRHPRCTLSFHNVRMIWQNGEQPPQDSNSPEQPETTTLEDLIEGCFICTVSALFRRSAFITFPDWIRDESCADWALFVLAAQQGTVGYLSDVMAVYRQRSGGFWSGRSRTDQLQLMISFYQRLQRHLANPYRVMTSTMLGRQWHQLALECRRAGDEEGVRRCLSESLAAQPDQRRTRWTLRRARGNDAVLRFSDGDPTSIGIAIGRASSGERFDIQLNHADLHVSAGRHYSIRFRARADEPRDIAVGLAEAHDPWSGLGFYTVVSLDRDWRQVDHVCRATADDDNARIHFDVGASGISVELSDVTIVDSEGIPADPFGLSLVAGGRTVSRRVADSA